MALLETEELTKIFGGLVAVDRVSLTVDEGAIHSIIGPNGAGKTTFFNVLCGLMVADYGHVKFKGQDITGLPFHTLSPRSPGGPNQARCQDDEQDYPCRHAEPVASHRSTPRCGARSRTGVNPWPMVFDRQGCSSRRGRPPCVLFSASLGFVGDELEVMGGGQ